MRSSNTAVLDEPTTTATPSAPPVPQVIKDKIINGEQLSASDRVAACWHLNNEDASRSVWRRRNVEFKRLSQSAEETDAAKRLADEQAKQLNSELAEFIEGFSQLGLQCGVLAPFIAQIPDKLRQAVQATISTAQKQIRSMEIAAEGERQRCVSYLVETADPKMREELSCLQKERSRLNTLCAARADILGCEPSLAAINETCQRLSSGNDDAGYRAALEERKRSINSALASPPPR